MREVSPGPRLREHSRERANQKIRERRLSVATEMAARGSLLLLLVHLRWAGSESEQMHAASLRSLLRRNGDWHPLDGAATFLMIGQA